MNTWVAVVFFCSPVFIHCDDANAWDRMQFSTVYPSEPRCAEEAKKQLDAMPPTAGGGTMMCMRQ